MFGCQEACRYLDAWVDGELDPTAALHVEAHLATCAACRSEAELLHTLKRTLAGLREQTPAPPRLRSQLAMLLDAEDSRQTDQTRAQSKRKHAAGFAVAGAALAGLVLATRGDVAGRAAGGEDVSRAGIVPQLLENIVQGHTRELPVEVSGRPEQVASFFRNRLEVPVRPMLFPNMPAQLVGGRFSDVRDHTAATLYYDYNGRRVSVFVFDPALLPQAEAGVERRVVGNRPVYVARVRGYTVAFSEIDGVGYAVASDLPTQDTLSIVQHASLQW